MPRTVGIGHQDFEKVRMSNNFYIDKTKLIREWWESNDEVTLITRPRRFGKTLNMSMLEKFFSVEYAERGDLFEGLSIWEDEKYRKLQGTYPVISLSFANLKDRDYQTARKKLCLILSNLYSANRFLMNAGILDDKERKFFEAVSVDMDDATATFSLNQLSLYLSRYYGKKVIILLDEYDTPMQEAYVGGYWEQLVTFTRGLFHATFKTNPYLNRAFMTGITRVSKESLFSDLNNLKVITTTSEEYTDSFGFTEEEVFTALDEYSLSDKKLEVKHWYNGFTFGNRTDIYNPWSIINYLNTGRVQAYWANTSSNSLAGKLLREGNRSTKNSFEALLQGDSLCTEIDEQIVYSQLDTNEQAMWSLLLASGYLKVKHFEAYMTDFGEWKQNYELELTNFEVKVMFRGLIHRWFDSVSSDYNDFIKAMLTDNLKAMNVYMNQVALQTFSYFDTSSNPSRTEPERFYHGFVLGLMVDLADKYILTSNRESGFGRYDVMLEPRQKYDDAMILEFKVRDPEDEKELSDTVQEALKQIERKKYEVALTEKGISREKIRKYGFAFQGKQMLIGKALANGSVCVWEGHSK